MSDNQRSASTSSVQSQFAKSTCQEHLGEDLDHYCKNCRIATCHKCQQTKKHKHHKWTTISKEAQECVDIAQEYISEANELISKHENDISQLNEKIELNRQRKETNLQQIKDREAKLIEEVKKNSAELSRICEEHEMRLNRDLTELKNKSEREVSQLRGFEEFFADRIDSSSNKTIVDYKNDLQDKRDSYQAPETEELIDQNSFYVGRNDFSELQEIFGGTSHQKTRSNLSSTGQPISAELEEISSFELKPGTDLMVQAIEDNMAYIHNNLRSIRLVNNSNQQLQHVDIGRNPSLRGEQLSAFVAFDNGEIVFTCRNQRKLWKCSQSGWINTLIPKIGMLPIGLGKSLNGEILLCVATRAFREVDSSAGKVVVIAFQNTGERQSILNLVREYPQAPNNPFQWPYRVIQNKNSDICVIDFDTQRTSKLKVLNQQGQLKFCYQGQFLAKPFVASDVACDKSCRIIVTDILNNRIHLLSQEGSFIRYLCTSVINKPWVVSLSDKTMWVGCGRTTMKVFKYYANVSETTDATG